MQRTSAEQSKCDTSEFTIRISASLEIGPSCFHIPMPMSEQWSFNGVEDAIAQAIKEATYRALSNYMVTAKLWSPTTKELTKEISVRVSLHTSTRMEVPSAKPTQSPLGPIDALNSNEE